MNKRPSARLGEVAGAAVGRWPPGLRRAVLHFALLCLGIAVITMVPFRIGRDDRLIVYLVVGALVAGCGVVALTSGRWLARVPSGRAATDTIRRHMGLPLVGLVFFVAWTAVYACLWLFHPEEAFQGISASPRLSDFFYYAVSTALTSPPEGIAAGSRGVRAASLIEMLMGFAVVGSYVASFLDWDRGSR